MSVKKKRCGEWLFEDFYHGNYKFTPIFKQYINYIFFKLLWLIIKTLMNYNRDKKLGENWEKKNYGKD